MALRDLRNLNSLRVAANDRFFGRLPRPAPEQASVEDLYLAPHFDDICFSLGAFVAARRRGTLLTLFSNSNYVARPEELQVEPGRQTAAISALRLAEDRAFASAVGLRQCTAGLDEAPLRGRGPFESEKAGEDADSLDEAVIQAIATMGAEPGGAERPWLFCPIGIGGHIDHLALLRIVLRHQEALRRRYRIAFYEDLHYASDWTARVGGLARFRALAAPLRSRRSRHAIAASEDKIALAALYPSQFVEPPRSIVPFTPAQAFAAPAHEALWTAE